MYNWLLYQLEELVIITVDTLSWVGDNIWALPWKMIAVAVLIALILNY